MKVQLRQKLLVFLIIFLPGMGLSSLLPAQNAPVTTVTTIINAVPGVVNVPVTITNFSNIGAISLSLDYDNSVLNFIQGTPNMLLPALTVNDNDLGNGFHRLIIGWFSPCITLPDGNEIVTLSFNYIGGTSALSWFDNGGSCEYGDCANVALNDLPTAAYYVNGYVCGPLGDPGVINGDNLVCTGASGVFYTINAVNGASGYVWTVPPGALITGGGNSTWIDVDYPQGSSSGYITAAAINSCITGPPSQVAVTVNSTPDVPVIWMDQLTLHSDTCCGNQWYLNGNPIPGATGQIYTTSTSGAYFDIVTENFCSSDTSNIIDVVTSVDESMWGTPKVYPNPAREILIVNMRGKKVNEISLYSIDGSLVRRFNGEHFESEQPVELSISDVQGGIYILRMVSGSLTISSRVEIY